MIRGVHRIIKYSQSPSRLLEFYRDIIGFREIAWSSRINGGDASKSSMHHGFLLKAQSLCIEIRSIDPSSIEDDLDRSKFPNIQLTSLCLDVLDIRSVVERLATAGFRIASGPSDFGFFWSASVVDPDGQQIEIMELLDPFDEAQVFWSDPPFYS